MREIDKICHVRYELNIYTRLCEIFRIERWGVWGGWERERWGERDGIKQ